MINSYFNVFVDKILPYLMEPSGIEPLTSCVQSRRSPSWAKAPSLNAIFSILHQKTACLVFIDPSKLNKVEQHLFLYSLERRWSSRTFRYGYLVTTSPQSRILPWWAPSLRLSYPLLVKPAPMVWRAVCTRPGNVFTAACWSAITSDSDFMQASCSLQSELRMVLRD